MDIAAGYKQTDIGIVPDDWEVVSVCDVATNNTGLTYSPENVSKTGTLVLRSSNIQDGKLCFCDNVFVEMEIPKRAQVKEGDILVCVRNGSTALIGKSALITSEAKGMAFGAFMTVLRARDIDNKFLLYIWQHSETQRQIHETFGATINQITNADFKRILIPKPALKEEQSMIATCLFDVDELIKSSDTQIEKKQHIKEGVMQRLLTGKTRLPGYSGKWATIKFADIYKYAREGGTPATSIPCYYHPAAIPFAKIDDLKNKYLQNTASYISEEGLNNSSAWIIPESSVLLSNGATLGEVSINKVRLSTKQGILGIIPKDNYSPEFLYYVLKSNQFKRELERVTTHGTMDCAYLKDINTIDLFLPSDIKEQEAIASVLSDMDEEIEALEAARGKYILIKQGMMQKLLTGQIRLI